jgi:hypothetical protein
MIKIVLIGLGAWLLGATGLSILLGKIMNTHATPPSDASHEPVAVERRRRAS